MTLQSGLALYAYDLVNTQFNRLLISDEIEELDFTTTAPGGFGDLSCKLKNPLPPTVPTQLRVFKNVALMDYNNPNTAMKTSTGAVFLGRWDEPGLMMDANGDGDVYNLHAMGASHCLQDDPSDTAYSLQTAQSILASEYSAASAYLQLDSDRTYVLPNNPSTTCSPSFNSKNLEDKLNELSDNLGDYPWCVWDHPTKRDFYGFPTWTLYWHLRDTGTQHYTGFIDDEASFDIRPAAEYSYNTVQLKYRDATTNAPSSITVHDSRLAGSGAQNNAPFPRRKIVKDYTGYHLSGAQASSIANNLLSQYQNGGWKISLDVDQVRDANGNVMPLHHVRADTNIFLPDLSAFITTANVQLPTNLVTNGNLFYISETHYTETSGQNPRLTITCNSFWDTTDFQIMKMQYTHKKNITNTKIPHVVLNSGETETGPVALNWGAYGLANDVLGTAVNYKTSFTATPSSLAIAQTSAVNVKSTSTGTTTNTGFEFSVTINANGAGGFTGTYTASG